jgi:hypothetical protein
MRSAVTDLDHEPVTLDWVAVGVSAFGLVQDDRILAVVYWSPADVAETADGGHEPVVTEAGFSWVASDAPWDHFYLCGAPHPSDHEWSRARELAAHAYFAHAGPRSRS